MELKHMLTSQQVLPPPCLVLIRTHPCARKGHSWSHQSHVLSQRRKETEADATFKDFYKNKYRRSHMHNSRFVDTNHKYAKGAAGDLGATKGGALTRSVLDNSLPQQSSGSLFDTIGPFDENAPILDQWNPVSSRLHQHTTVAMEGTGSSWSYQYGKDHVSHRGPPYQINNTKAVWQR